MFSFRNLKIVSVSSLVLFVIFIFGLSKALARETPQGPLNEAGEYQYSETNNNDSDPDIFSNSGNNSSPNYRFSEPDIDSFVSDGLSVSDIELSSGFNEEPRDSLYVADDTKGEFVTQLSDDLDKGYSMYSELGSVIIPEESNTFVGATRQEYLSDIHRKEVFGSEVHPLELAPTGSKLDPAIKSYHNDVPGLAWEEVGFDVIPPEDRLWSEIAGAGILEHDLEFNEPVSLEANANGPTILSYSSKDSTYIPEVNPNSTDLSRDHLVMPGLNYGEPMDYDVDIYPFNSSIGDTGRLVGGGSRFIPDQVVRADIDNFIKQEKRPGAGYNFGPLEDIAPHSSKDLVTGEMNYGGRSVPPIRDDWVAWPSSTEDNFAEPRVDLSLPDVNASQVKVGPVSWSDTLTAELGDLFPRLSRAAFADENQKIVSNIGLPREAGLMRLKEPMIVNEPVVINEQPVSHDPFANWENSLIVDVSKMFTVGQGERTLLQQPLKDLNIPSYQNEPIGDIELTSAEKWVGPIPLPPREDQEDVTVFWVDDNPPPGKHHGPDPAPIDSKFDLPQPTPINSIEPSIVLSYSYNPEPDSVNRDLAIRRVLMDGVDSYNLPDYNQANQTMGGLSEASTTINTDVFNSYRNDLDSRGYNYTTGSGLGGVQDSILRYMQE